MKEEWGVITTKGTCQCSSVILCHFYIPFNKNNTTSTTNGTGTAYPSGEHEFTMRYIDNWGVTGDDSRDMVRIFPNENKITQKLRGK